MTTTAMTTTAMNAAALTAAPNTTSMNTTATNDSAEAATTEVAATPRARLLAESGQATAEYALVLLGVAAIAMLLLAWATDTGTIDRLLDAVLDSIIGLVP